MNSAIISISEGSAWRTRGTRGVFFYEKVIKSQGRRGGPPFCLSSGETLLVLCRAA